MLCLSMAEQSFAYPLVDKSEYRRPAAQHGNTFGIPVQTCKQWTSSHTSERVDRKLQVIAQNLISNLLKRVAPPDDSLPTAQ